MKELAKYKDVAPNYIEIKVGKQYITGDGDRILIWAYDPVQQMYYYRLNVDNINNIRYHEFCFTGESNFARGLKLCEEGKKVFNKDNLKTGMFVEIRNGDAAVVNVWLKAVVFQDGSHIHFNQLNDDLTSRDINTIDIIKVYKPNKMAQRCFERYIYGTLVFDRNRDCSDKFTAR